MSSHPPVLRPPRLSISRKVDSKQFKPWMKGARGAGGGGRARGGMALWFLGSTEQSPLQQKAGSQHVRKNFPVTAPRSHTLASVCQLLVGELQGLIKCPRCQAWGCRLASFPYKWLLPKTLFSQWPQGEELRSYQFFFFFFIQIPILAQLDLHYKTPSRSIAWLHFHCHSPNPQACTAETGESDTVACKELMAPSPAAAQEKW